ncbi:MAG: sigma-54 dependent transcriptional regulator [Pseudomonadota bacterium]
MTDFSIFVVDDEEMIRDAAAMNLREYRVRTFERAEDAVEAVKRDQPDLILMDVGLPGMNGVEAMGLIREIAPEVLFIMITAYEDVDTVVAAMKLGAYDYVVKPLYMDSLKVGIRNALESIRLRKEVQRLQKWYLEENLPCFIAESDAIQDVMQFVDRVAKSPDAPVMILGETGTGKELFARAVHYKSPNCRGPFVTLNCAAIPREIIESELFGYEPGAFSGASPKGKAGLIEQAQGGTLFLDEVGDLGVEAQAKLLRFLDSGEYYKVGGTRIKQARARVVSATNRDLDAMTAAGEFRRDLYFRLAVIKIELPSLKKRPEDILPIARFFLMEFSRKYQKTFTGLSPEAEAFLLGHSWEGNVRELKSLMERGVLSGRGPVLGPDDFGRPTGGPVPDKPAPDSRFTLPPLTPEGLDLAALLEAVEKIYVEEAFRQSGGNDSKAAQFLGINYYTYRYRKKKLLGP